QDAGEGLERVGLEPGHRRRPERARVVDEEVEPPACGGHEPLPKRRVGDIARERDDAGQRGGRRPPAVAGAGARAHGGAAGGERGGEGEAEALARPGHDGGGGGHTGTVRPEVKFRSRRNGRVETTDLLTLGEVARRSGFPQSALRFYEREGLLRTTRTS